MKKMIWLTSLFIGFVIFVVPGILAATLNVVPAEDQPGYNSDQRLSIYGKRGVSQKFVSKENNLAAIGTSIRNPNLKNKKEIILSLYDKEEKLVRTSTLNGQNFQDGDFVKFYFDSISDSAGKTYSFTLFSPTADSEETIEVFYIKSPTDVVLEFTYDEINYPGGLPIVTFHKPNSKLEVIKEVYLGWLSRLFSLR